MKEELMVNFVAKRTVSGQGVGRCIIKAIRDAKSRIFIVSPYISSDYAKLLLEKARSGVDVRVVTSRGRRAFSAAVLSIYSGKISKSDLQRFERYRDKKLRTMDTLLAIYTCIIILMMLSVSGLIPLMSQFVLYASIVASAVLVSTIAYFLEVKHVIMFLIGTIILSIILMVMFEGVPFSVYVLAMFQMFYPIGTVMSYIKWLSARTYKGVIREFGPPRQLVKLKFAPSEGKFIHSKIYIVDDRGFSGSVNLTFKSINENIETVTIYEGEDIGELEKQFYDIWDMLDDSPIDIIADVYSILYGGR